MKVAIASDHGGFVLKGQLLKAFPTFEDLGVHAPEAADYPDQARKLTDAVTSKRVELGLLLCGTGIGMSIAANKVRGIRAALCHTEFEARVAREHNDANVLCLGERVIGPSLAQAIVEVFLSSKFQAGRHAVRLAKIE